ncbi:solute carrier family 23 member 2-like [Tachypleus tridentatus]|uniref:solute carrier family 23 member 2-like n=1 Tax=Tachypleus tridentatus TaxID=6853 RepID=UPI003FD3C04D
MGLLIIPLMKIQGAIIGASIFEMIMGLTGVRGVILQWLTPSVIVPTISLVGLSLFEEATFKASKNWGIAIITVLLLVLFSQYLGNFNIPGCSYSRKRGWKIKRIPFFKLFPVDHLHLHFGLSGQWGLPTVSIGAVFGMFTGILASVLESVEYYYACARLVSAPPLPPSAINREIFAEGICCIVSGIWGSGCGMTFYSQNIAAIKKTRVYPCPALQIQTGALMASRRVIQYGAVTMLIFAVLGKFGAFLNTIPEPIGGGITCVMFAMVTGAGLSNVQFIDLHSSRNIFSLDYPYLWALPYQSGSRDTQVLLI